MATVLDAPDHPAADHGGATQAGVSLDGVSVAYGSTAAVHDVTLDVEAGSMVALLGPSGCGKTSLLRAVAGLERPTAGTVTIGSTVVSTAGGRKWVKPERRHVGMVFQDGALFPHLTVADNIAFGLAKRRRSADRVAELLDLVDLTGFADRLPETLSGGQQQRVALARSLAPNPSVLLLDEPFSALDTGLRNQVRSEVVRILRRVGVTAIFVTHDQDEAFVLGDQVAVMNEGRVEQVGTPDEIYRTPTTEWVAGFVGEANLLSGPAPLGATVETSIGPVPVLTDPIDAATTLTALVRPEQIQLHPGDDATIEAVEYYGHDVRYELRLSDGSTLAARSLPDVLHQVGDRVGVSYASGPTAAWPASSR
ncbi:MAG: ABC transporter ATP-binding protein [Ilumatobacteraceae bacterium]